MINALVNKARKNENFINELIEKKNKDINKRKIIEDHVRKMVDDDRFIFTRKDIKRQLSD